MSAHQTLCAITGATVTAAVLLARWRVTEHRPPRAWPGGHDSLSLSELTAPHVTRSGPAAPPLQEEPGAEVRQGRQH
ncbi:hypothetical protein C3486_05030 [Streptomyces sp. Ru73]|uniref:hypothetical protein n=1 Tax=Streptomyces sp. Ru73 TaxID=2080748 RepID=UPI000CDDF16D|nr:hypothetical protein [Streptomyces sp. Ru73]POX42375.1 hypothetical protein C3486_05030 [Streptomyces sp. Ru73]